MTDNNDLKIIIVLFNSSNLIFECLEQLKNFKIIIVDNGKNEHLLKKIRLFSNIEKIVTKNKNIGFGNAVNFAFEKINTKFFLILNPDIILDEASILTLLKTMKENTNCAIASPFVPTDKDSYGNFPEKGKGVPRNKYQQNCSKTLENIKPEGNLCVDVAKGCSLLINTEHFKNIGMFNQKYFLFWEEIDLCKKFREKKLSVIINPNSIGAHEQGNSTKNDLLSFITRVYHSELSPLIYFNVMKLSPTIYWKMIKYIFRTLSYLFIFNFKKSFMNLLKFLATLNYIFFK